MLACVNHAITHPGGSCVLVADAGTTSRDAVTLLGHMHSYHVCTPSISAGYTLGDFEHFLKECLSSAGVDGKPTVMLLEDFHVVEDEFLTHVNSLLNSGDVTGLFTPRELDTFLSPLKVGGSLSVSVLIKCFFFSFDKASIVSSWFDGKPMVMLLEDFYVVEDELLTHVNSLLNSGDVTGLFTPRELDTFLSPLKVCGSLSVSVLSVFFSFDKYCIMLG